MGTNQSIKEKEKTIINNIKQEAKKQNFKVISNCIYKEVEDYFVFAVFWVQPNQDNWTLSLRMNIKANSYDNLFWDILVMPENKNAKASLRANGAFACPPFQWNEKSYNVCMLDGMKREIASAINDFNNEINNLIDEISINFVEFNSFILSQEHIIDEKLLEMIANISKKDFAAAKRIAHTEIEKGQRGGYRNKGKDIYEFVIEYCNKHIND